jgi:hypothetical protein
VGVFRLCATKVETCNDAEHSPTSLYYWDYKRSETVATSWEDKGSGSKVCTSKGNETAKYVGGEHGINC